MQVLLVSIILYGLKNVQGASPSLSGGFHLITFCSRGDCRVLIWCSWHVLELWRQRTSVSPFSVLIVSSRRATPSSVPARLSMSLSAPTFSAVSSTPSVIPVMSSAPFRPLSVAVPPSRPPVFSPASSCRPAYDDGSQVHPYY